MVKHVCRQERESTEPLSNHLTAPEYVVALSPTLEGSECFWDASTTISQNTSVVLLSNTSILAQTDIPEAQEVEESMPMSPNTSDQTLITFVNSTDSSETPLHLQDIHGSALQVRVGLPVPKAPEFVQGPRWNATLSSSDMAVVTGALDSPGIIFYAVCYFFAIALVPCTDCLCLCEKSEKVYALCRHMSSCLIPDKVKKLLQVVSSLCLQVRALTAS